MNKEKYTDIFMFIAKSIEKRGYDPKDPGGVTIYGITKLYHPQMFEKIKNAVYSENDDKINEAITNVYYEYYNTVTHKAKELEFLFPLNIQYFDMAFNAGCDDAIFVLQRTIKEIFDIDELIVDGDWGPQTSKYVNFVKGNITECLKSRIYYRYVINRIDRYTEKSRRYSFGLIKNRALKLSSFLENNDYVTFCMKSEE